MITALAIISAAVWALVIAGLSPSVVRIYRNRTHGGDEWRAVSLFQAFLFVAFNVRRIFMGHDPAGIPGLYAVSILLGTYALVLLWHKRRD